MRAQRRIVVTGASGNVGTGVLRRIVAAMPDATVTGICRRPPRSGHPYDRVQWLGIDLADDSAAAELERAFRDADVVVHLAWAIQPVREEAVMHRVNVDGTRAVLHAVRAAGVPHLVYSSTLGVYAPDAARPVDEHWPDTGQASSAYSRHKVTVERMLDHFDQNNPDITVARFRPTLVVQREAATEIKSLFLGPLIPPLAMDVLRRGFLPVLPLPSGLALQFVHADDVGDAVVQIIERRCSGTYNLAAEPLDAQQLAGIVGARAVEVPRSAVRSVVGGLFSLHALSMSPGWFDVATRTPLMNTDKARTELGWQPRYSSVQGAKELLDGLADGVTGTSAALGG